ncbi:MAG: ATP-binding protein [Anaerolineae bacterium]|nr:ATP-binding protein [Anaerolineae bacterium]MCX8068608.1 ATP-binding protein [Anaerolineae bacterium]MDW7992852.1 ATP-binding protein [Anaerolineae bacterium]
MTFLLWESHLLPYLEWPTYWLAILLLGLFVGGFLWSLISSRKDFVALRRGRLVLFLVLLFLTPLLNQMLILRPAAPNLLPPPFLPAEPAVPALPLFGFLPLAIAAIWLGRGPALILALLAGLFRTTSYLPTESLAFAFQVWLASFFLRQDYRGSLARALRQPVLAFPLAAALLFVLTLIAVLTGEYRPGYGLVVLDYTLTLSSIAVPLTLLETLAYGLLFQVIYLLFPHIRPVGIAQRTPPYARTLKRRFLFIFIPLFVLFFAVLVYAVAASAMRIATRLAVDAMLRDATNGATGVSEFLSTGQSLIRQFAAAPDVWSKDPAACSEQLRTFVQMLPFFSRLTAYDEQGGILCTYPHASESEVVPTLEEQEFLTVVQVTGGVQITPAHRGPEGQIILSFISSLGSVEGEPHGALVGRVELGLNPLLDRVLTSLQWTMQQGEGFVVDEQGRIVAHPDPARLLEQWGVDQSTPPLVTVEHGEGWVRETRDSRTNARLLSCYVPVPGSPWAIVILVPHHVRMMLAFNIAAPLLILLAVLTGILTITITLTISQLTRPLNLLARAAEEVARGNLDRAVPVTGDDEIARLGEAMERMRVSLRHRLEDLSLLLRVAQEVSATLDLSQGIPRILEGALQALNARVARIVLLSAAGDPQVAMGRGDFVNGVSHLDRALALAARDVANPVVLENLRRARMLSVPDSLLEEIQAALALPVMSKGQPVAVMWVGFARPRRIEPSEIDLLSTLASQTAVLVENARLFQLAEGGRRRLSAILTSTSDAILVTDRDDRILLVNPAAERALGIPSEELVGRLVTEVPLEESLVRILREPLGRGGPLVEEVPLPNGRVFYASASTILSAEGENMGRVVVMRDITHFKELDEMKSEFVATVSHDLRAPLTFIRGYASMLPMAGDLTPKQQEYLEKIFAGIEQMSALVENLLNLQRIEAGIGLEERPCHLGALLVEAVDGMRARAVAKGLTLSIEASEPAPVVWGDAMLLRQAIANLVDNAIKYTPAGGKVTVGLRVVGQEVHISVTDTGIGIAPEDQVRLFEKFYRIRHRGMDEAPGSGLGLAIVKSIVERHGGRVWVESQLNRGSTFTIALPLRRPSEARDSER